MKKPFSFGTPVNIHGHIMGQCDRGYVVGIEDGRIVVASDISSAPIYKLPIGAKVVIPDGREGEVFWQLSRLPQNDPCYGVRVLARHTRCGPYYETLCCPETDLTK